MSLTKKRWLILIFSCLINLCIGSIYAWSVFASPMAKYLSTFSGKVITPGDLAIVFSIANAVGPVTMISGGFFNDKLGPRTVIFVGGLMFGGGMLLSGFAKNITMLIVSYGLLAGLGLGMTYGCTISNSVKFFPDHRGLIGGLTTAAYGISSVLVSPIANALNNSVGVASSFKIFGIVFGVVVCVGAFFTQKCPVGFVPQGWTPPVRKNVSAVSRNRDWKEMLVSPIFYVMIVMLTCGATCGMMCISQASSVAQNLIGMSIVAATTVVSILALFNAVGRICAGTISDLIGRINTLTIALVGSIIGLALLFFSEKGSVATFYIGIAIIGISFGSFMGIFPGFTADEFGTKNNSVNYGIMFIGFAAAGLLGPNIMTQFYDMQGSYSNAFLVAGLIAIVGLLMTLAYRALSKSKAEIIVYSC